MRYASLLALTSHAITFVLRCHHIRLVGWMGGCRVYEVLFIVVVRRFRLVHTSNSSEQ